MDSHRFNVQTDTEQIKCMKMHALTSLHLINYYNIVLIWHCMLKRNSSLFNISKVIHLNGTSGGYLAIFKWQILSSFIHLLSLTLMQKPVRHCFLCGTEKRIFYRKYHVFFSLFLSKSMGSDVILVQLLWIQQAHLRSFSSFSSTHSFPVT